MVISERDVGKHSAGLKKTGKNNGVGGKIAHELETTADPIIYLLGESVLLCGSS